MADFSGFEWDENKRRTNLLKHRIDFADAMEVFADTDQFTYRSPGPGEDRFVSVGRMRNEVIAVVFTKRGDRIRIISARAARKNEKLHYGR